MIEDLLDLSGIERGTMALDALPTSVEQIVRDATAVPVRDPHPLRHDIESGLPAVFADPNRLRQVLGNLLSNARKFSPPNAPITVHAAREGSRVAITVANNGRGIPDEELERIFEAFVQTDPALTRAAGGLGTGLYLVKQLCGRMGAEVRVAGNPGAGSSFTILLRPAEEYPAAS